MRISFKVSLTVSIMAIVGSLSLVFYFHISSVSRQASHRAAGQLFNTAFGSIETAAFELVNKALNTLHLAAEIDEPEFDHTSIGNSLPLGIAFELLRANPDLYSLYYGHQDSRFVQIISARQDPMILKAHEAPPMTWWILRSIAQANDTQRKESWYFVTQDRQLLSKKIVDHPEYDPRTRPWYSLASQTDQPVVSDVYTYHSLQKPGITVSKKGKHQGIVGVDVTLQQLQQLVSSTRISDHSQVMILDQNNLVIANSRPDTEADSSNALLDLPRPGPAEPGPGQANDFQQLRIHKALHYAKTSAPLPASRLRVAAIAPASDFNRHFSGLQKDLANITLAWLIIFAPVTYLFSRQMANRLSAIAADAGKIKEFIFEPAVRPPSRILEFFLLETNFDAMRSSLFEKTQDLKQTQDKLNRLVELGISISAERDPEKLMEKVLLGAKELTNADGGTLYHIEDDTLAFKIIYNDTLGVSPNERHDIALDPVPLYDEAGKENHANVVSHSVWESKSIRIDDAYNNEVFDFSGTRTFDRANHYHSRSFLTVPLMPLGAKPIGALQLINCKDADGNIVPFGRDLIRFVEALGAQAATVRYNLDLLEGQKHLMDALIQLLAGAIDAKSPYTGGHCERVPELALMMARAACDRTEGVFADFSFQNEDQWREFSIGAWLHDCGKVVTPEYVVDKATKLETIYNRIHEIRTRFEVLLRDAQVDYYKGLAQGLDKEALSQAYERRKQDLTDKFAFVADCNAGGEFMAEEKVTRLMEIAGEQWVRNFDIRLGLSHEEALRYQDCTRLPAMENLLADRPWHLIPRTRDIRQQYAALDFKLPVPEYLYNRGELYNLSVQRGTLTAEERFKISEHIMQTIAMLEKMPFPPQLARVPEYAGTHHETMIGTGYPRQLDASALALPSRIMAVADIFEALTASDRPYKKAKTLSEAIRILSFFKDDQHIDPDVFELFLTSGVYRSYADRFLKPEQIDEVDIAQYLS